MVDIVDTAGDERRSLRAPIPSTGRTRSPNGEYFTMHHTARTPSRHPIFLPSA
jgi:hypothetical protein